MKAVRDEINQGRNQGVLYAFSAGNAVDQNTNGVDVEVGTYNAWPCKDQLDNVICVTAVDRNGNRPLWANYGKNRIHLGAPGRDILSTLNGIYNPDGCSFTYSDSAYGKAGESCIPGYAFPAGSGTSFAAPHVTGIVALTKALNPGFTYQQLKEYVLLAGQPTPTGSLDGKTHMGTMANADVAIRAFGDSFDDASTNARFFSNATPTGVRWAVAQHATGVTCDNFVKTVATTVDRVAEVKYSGIAGSPGSSWTLAAYEQTYPPGSDVQSLVVRIATTDGSSFSGKNGRIGVGVVGDTGQSQLTCAATGQAFTSMSFGGSMIGGLELHTRKPFIYFNPPYVEYTYPAISVSGVSKLSISLEEGVTGVNLRITNSATGSQLFYQQAVPYPGGWNWTGTDKAAFMYYGNTDQSGTLYVRSFLSGRP